MTRGSALLVISSFLLPSRFRPHPFRLRFAFRFPPYRGTGPLPGRGVVRNQPLRDRYATVTPLHGCVFGFR